MKRYTQLCRYLFLICFLTACDRPVSSLALGTLERDRIIHSATMSEIIIATPVAPGSAVEQGTLLVQLDDTLQKARVRKAQADVAQAKAGLDKLHHGARREEIAMARASVNKAKAVLKESEASFKRAQQLFNQSVFSPADKDKTLAARDAHLAELERAEQYLFELTRGAREEDLAIAEAHLASANALLSIEKKQLENLAVVATRSGIVDSLPWHLGERVTAGSPLAIVLVGKAPYARVYVPEPYRVRLAVGDRFEVYVDGLLDPVTGILVEIATEPAFTPHYALNQTERARLMYLAKIQLPESEMQLPSGLPVQVKLL